MSLSNLGKFLSELGRREDALAAAREANDIYRRLATDRPDAFLPDLATSLNNLGNGLSGSAGARTRSQPRGRRATSTAASRPIGPTPSCPISRGR